MKKKNLKLQELGKAHTKEHLKRVHPFLRKDFRTLDYKETKSKEVFVELFGESEPVELWKLRAVYEFQK